MRKLFLAAGVAALAISAPAAADKGGNKGNRGGGQAAQMKQGGGSAAKANRGGERRQAARAERREGRQAVRVDRRSDDRRQAQRSERSRPVRFAQAERGRQDKARNEDRRGRSVEVRQQRVEKAQRRQVRDARRSVERAFADRNRGNRVERGRIDRDDRRRDAFRVRGDDRRIVSADSRVRIRDYDRFQARFADNRVLGLIDGCPPGLAKKNNGCLPPGQAKKMVGSLIPATLRSSFLPVDLRDYWRDNDDYYYRYNDGYLYRVNRDNNLIASLLPLFGGGYTLGQAFPYQSSAYYMPSYYQPFYQDTADAYYRYDDGYVYAIDPYSGMISNIIPTYDYGYGVGQMLPASYSYYNLPYPYRSWYADSDDYYYRYAPGAIYQVDRDTQLIAAVVSLLSGGLGVGQQLPLGYSTYNVPFAYRDQYYDTPDNWYRYSNGYIYQVDPTSRLITAVIDAIV